MAMTATLNVIDAGQKTKTIVFNLAFSGSYATGGEAINPATILPVLKAAVPVAVWVLLAGGYTGEVTWTAGDWSTAKLKIYSSGTTELTAGAYPAALTSANGINRLELVFKKTGNS